MEDPTEIPIPSFTNRSYFNISPNRTGDEESLDYMEGKNMENIVRIVVPVMFGLIVVVGLFGNALVVIVVLCNQQMRNTTNLLIINLAMADLCFIVTCVPFTAADYALPMWPFGDTWCRIVQYMIHVCAYASVYTLVLMSLDRFLAVVLPITSMSIRTERNTYIAIACLWVIILGSNVPVLIVHGEVTYYYMHENRSSCIFKEDYNISIFQICFFLFAYAIPVALICGLYLLMLKRLWYGVAPGGHVSNESLRSKKRVTRMVVVVVVIFAACWLPIQIVLMLKSLNVYPFSPVTVTFQIASHILAYMNSCVNPILYAFLSENFRKAFGRVIFCGSKRHLGSRLDFERTDARGLSTNTKSDRITNDIL